MMSLRNLQQWMQAVITHPDGVDAGAISPAACEAFGTMSLKTQVDELILPSKNLTSEQRIGVYAHAYYARLLECLHCEFPALVSLLGEEIFNGLCVEYLQSCPPKSYTLGDLGGRFHQFLLDNRQRASGDGASASNGSQVDWIDMMLDLAITERTYSEVFSGPGVENSDTLSADALSLVEPELMGAICLTFAPCVRLLRLATRAHEYAIAVRKTPDATPELPAFTETFLVITRRSYVVKTLVAERTEYLLLEQLVEGLCLEQAIASICETDGVDEEYLEQQIGVWFQKWAIDRLFTTFRIES